MATNTGWQTPPDADVILRASGGKEIHAHKLVLSLASPVFMDMFSLPQPPPGAKSSQLPIVDINDPPEALEMFLQIIYPTSNPPTRDIETWTPVVHLANKYDAGIVLDVYKDHLLLMCIDSPPLHVYAILCFSGRKKEAEAIARRVSFASLAPLNSHPLLRLMTLEHYQRLVMLMVSRDKRMREILREGRANFVKSLTWPCNDTSHHLYSGAIAASLQAAFEANPCVQVVEALGIVSSAPPTFSPCKVGCKYDVSGLRGYAEGLLSKLVEMAESLPWVD